MLRIENLGGEGGFTWVYGSVRGILEYDASARVGGEQNRIRGSEWANVGR